jgi:hypothetical protein
VGISSLISVIDLRLRFERRCIVHIISDPLRYQSPALKHDVFTYVIKNVLILVVTWRAGIAVRFIVVSI